MKFFFTKKGREKWGAGIVNLDYLYVDDRYFVYCIYNNGTKNEATWNYSGLQVNLREGYISEIPLSIYETEDFYYF